MWKASWLVDSFELPLCHQSVKVSLLIHTKNLPLSQLFCRAVDLFTFHHDMFLCQLYQSCHKPASWQGEKDRGFIFLPHCVFFPLGPFWERSKQDSATGMMRNATNWRSRAHVNSGACPPGGQAWNPVGPDSSSRPGEFCPRESKRPECYGGRWKEGSN